MTETIGAGLEELEGDVLTEAEGLALGLGVALGEAEGLEGGSEGRTGG